MDPECEVCTRELMEWRSQVDDMVNSIYYWIEAFQAGAFQGNDIKHILELAADQLSELGWRGNRIPFSKAI